MEKVRSYKDLKVWQRGTDLALDVYALSRKFPKDELYGLTSQVRRAAISIPSNIAEGSERKAHRDFLRFVRIASGSLAEVETQIYMAVRLGYITEEEYQNLQPLMAEIGRMLNGFANNLAEQLATGDRLLATT
jgi:four helix bundle protein